MMISRQRFTIPLMAMGLNLSTFAFAASTTPKKATTAPLSKSTKEATIPSAESHVTDTSPDGYTTSSSTRIDFSETSIDGKMKAPDGFMLQGHRSNSLSQMVKLRSNFRNELTNSKSATKALIK